MPFQIKDFASIVAAQINHARAVTEKITDFQPGSVARTLMEAPAVEMEELYLQMFLGLRDAIPVATFRSFGFDKLPAARAHGFVSVSLDQPPSAPIVIPMGTIFGALDGRSYYSTAAVTWVTSASVVRIPVAHDAVGVVGNIAAGQITASDFFNENYEVSNSLIVTGRDVEADTEREARFAEFVKALSRGTVVACLYAARQSRVLDTDGNIYEYVTRTGIDEQPGRVSIYIYSSLGIPSSAILSNGQRLLDGWRVEDTGEIVPGYRSAGVRVDLLPMVERTVALSIQVEMFSGYLLDAGVEQQLGDIFNTAIRTIQPLETLYLGTLVELLLSVTGVRSIVPANNANIQCAVNEALIPGVLTVAAL